MSNNKPKDFHYDYLDKKKNIANYRMTSINKLLSMFKYHNLPDTLPQIELEKILMKGFACVAKVNDNLYAFTGGLGGELDMYYRPTICVVANPFLRLTKEFKIGEDCVIIRNDSNMQGMYPLVEKYAYLMNENDVSRVIATVNTRLQILLSAGDDRTRQSADDYMQRLFDGKLATIADNAFLESLNVHTVANSQNQALNNLITHDQYLRACFLNDIGLSANTQLKKERLISSEIETNSESLYPIVDDMLENRRIGIQQVNDMFGTNIEVEFSSSWDYRAFHGASIHDVKEEVDTEDTEDKQDKQDTEDNDDSGENDDEENNDNDNDNNNEDKK